MSAKPPWIQVDAETRERLDAIAREMEQSRPWLAGRDIDEASRMQAHPGVEFRDGPAGRRAALKGGEDIWQIASVIKAVQKRGGDVIAETAALTGATPEQVRAAVGYYAEYRDEINERIRYNDELAETLEAMVLQRGMVWC